MPRAMLTGHRSVNPDCLNAMMDLQLDLNLGGDLTVISGGNLGTRTAKTGADRLWALAANKLGIPYEIWVPKGYGENYYRHNPSMLESFDSMLAHASKVVYCPSTLPFNVRDNFTRNSGMVDTADVYVVCSDEPPVALLSRSSGGTVHCVKVMRNRRIQEVHWIHAITGEDKGIQTLS